MRKVKIDRAVYLVNDRERSYRFLGRNPDWQLIKGKENFRNKKSISGYSRLLRKGKRVKFRFSLKD